MPQNRETDMSHTIEETAAHTCTCGCKEALALSQFDSGAPAISTLPSATQSTQATAIADEDDCDDEGACSCCASCAVEADGEGEARRNITPLLIACAVATFLGVILHVINPSAPAATSSAATLTAQILPLLSPLCALVATVLGLIIIAPGIKAAVLKRSVDINILMLIAVLGAWVLGESVEAAAVLLFFSVGEWLEEFATDRNRSSIEKLMDLTPQTVRVWQNGQVLEVPCEQVALASTVILRPGDRVPLDGMVAQGSATVDESPITGESMPVLKQPGDTIYAGSLDLDGKLEFTTTSTIEDSTLARIVALVKETQKKRTPYERFINRFARYYTPLVVTIAALVALVPTAITLLTPLDLGGLATWGYRALALLVIACPCALVIATPVSVVSGLTQSARMGVLVKGGAYLELASKVRAIAFDKTGTLTYGKPEVTDVVVLPSVQDPSGVDPHTRESILLLSAALEQDSTHPLARAVVTAATGGQVAGAETATAAATGEQVAATGGQPVTAPGATDAVAGATATADQLIIPRAQSVTELAGQGISGQVEGRAVSVGSPAFAAGLTSIDEVTLARIANMEKTATTVLVVLCDMLPIGLIAIKDRVRPESPALLRQLKEAGGMQAVMLTGDNPATARAIAEQVGITQVHAGLLPHEKTERLESLRREYGIIAMVGDGINDAPALSFADIGIAMGAASSDVAVQTADVALMANSIDVLPRFFALSRKVVGTIRTNITFALAVKALVMVLAIVGIAHMWMAIFADVGVLIIVLLYSMRLGLPGRPQKA